jgi:hypothetical protein
MTTIQVKEACETFLLAMRHAHRTIGEVGGRRTFLRRAKRMDLRERRHHPS